MRGVIHDFTGAGCYGHAIASWEDDGKVFFEKLETYKVKGMCFEWTPIFHGDLLSRNMQSGKVGVYEITSVYPKKSLNAAAPSDLYCFEAVFCGYLENGVVTLLPGYGITLTKKESRGMIFAPVFISIALIGVLFSVFSLIAR